MKTVTVALLLITGYCIKAQTTNQANASIDVYYGYRVLFNNFYNQLNTTKKMAWNRPLQLISVGLNEQVAITQKKGAFVNLVYSQVVPRTAQVQDSLKGKITGFVFNFSLGKYISTKSGVLGLFYYTGFNTGRLRLYDNELLRQKNPFFSPKIGLVPQLKFGKILLKLMMEYDYDISKPAWKRTAFSNNDKVALSSLKQTALTAQLGLGYVIK